VTGSDATSWKRAFGQGAADVIYLRLAQERKKLVAAQPPASMTAIVLRDRKAEVEIATKGFFPRLQRGQHRRAANGSGYSSGTQAGWAMNLDAARNSNGRRALGA
jgi:hypothetical protein